MWKKMMKLPKILHALLRLQRPHGGVNEGVAAEAVRMLVESYGHKSTTDSFGNLKVTIGDTGLWFTAHLDTVHWNDGEQTLSLLAGSNMLVADSSDGKPCVLGADDAAGVYILTEMIRHGKPGNYMFFLGEEVGGLGSSDFIRRNQTISADICVSFDRRGYSDVITHQGGWRTASDEFARALASELNTHGFKYKPSDAGLYTDSKEFAELVPECTNISVGYFDEHTARETLDIQHLFALRDAVLAIDWGALPVHRVPAPDDWMQSWNMKYGDANGNALGTPYTGLGVRISTALINHYEALPQDVLELLEELEELLND